MLRPSCSMMYGVKGCCFSSWWFTGLKSSENNWLWSWFCCWFLFCFCLFVIPSFSVYLVAWIVAFFLFVFVCVLLSFFLSCYIVYFLSYRIYSFFLYVFLSTWLGEMFFSKHPWKNPSVLLISSSAGLSFSPSLFLSGMTKEFRQRNVFLCGCVYCSPSIFGSVAFSRC